MPAIVTEKSCVETDNSNRLCLWASSLRQLPYSRHIARRHLQIAIGVRQRFFQRHDAIEHRKRRIDAVLMHHRIIRRQAAGNGDHRHAVTLGYPRHADRRFTVDRLAVQPPFAGDHQIGIAHRFIQAQGFSDDFDARPQARVEHAKQRRPMPPAAPAPGWVSTARPVSRSSSSP